MIFTAPPQMIATLNLDAEHAFQALLPAHRYVLRRRTAAYICHANAPHSKAGVDARAAALAPAWPAFAALTGEENALAAARVLTPFLHGFVSMELSNAFRLGGGLDAAPPQSLCAAARHDLS
jgi:hypothetical protein